MPDLHLADSVITSHTLQKFVKLTHTLLAANGAASKRVHDVLIFIILYLYTTYIKCTSKKKKK